jgi:hypothetical protein
MIKVYTAEQIRDVLKCESETRLALRRERAALYVELIRRDPKAGHYKTLYAVQDQIADLEAAWESARIEMRVMYMVSNADIPQEESDQ